MQIDNSGQVFNILYRPETHKGFKNDNDDVINYVVRTEEPFQNLARKEKFAGITATDVATGEFKRFRFDRILAVNKMR